MDKVQRIKELVKECNYHCNLYYNDNKPVLDNREYNLLYDELKSLEETTGVILSDSPTQRAGYPVVSSLPKVKHEIPLLSLDKIKEIPKLVKWLGNQEGVLMLKMDGGTGSLDYINGEVTQALTRGDSTTNIGEDISHNIVSIKNIPKSIGLTIPTRVIGENFMRYSSFNEINSKIKKEEDKYSHPRNLANGSVGLLDSKLCKERNIEFCAFNIIKGNTFETKQDQLQWLKSQGFLTVPYWMVTKDNLKETIETIIDLIPTFDYPIDGLVLSYNDIAYGESLGQTNHHYNSGMAFKFEDEFYTTTYDHTEWNTSRKSKIVPKGIFKSIKMDGADHDRATLHNLDRFRNMRLGYGDTIQTSKRNKIIPAIENNITRSNTEQVPTECPTCGFKAEIRLVSNTHDLFCTNPNCEAKLLQKLKHFISKQCFNISDIGEATLDVFIENEFIENYMDIFKITKFKKEILSLDGFAPKSYNKMLEAIEKSKTIEFSALITSLGISNVGSGTSKRIAKYFSNDINKFLAATKSHHIFMNIEDIGATTAYDIYSYFQDEENMNLFNELLSIITIKQAEEKKVVEVSDNPFKGITLYPTGKFSLKKEELKIKLEELGAIVESGYKKSLGMLIAGGDTSKSGKVDRAIADGVKVVSEEFLMQYIK
jgi:DNA ligase (NAD+)